MLDVKPVFVSDVPKKSPNINANEIKIGIYNRISAKMIKYECYSVSISIYNYLLYRSYCEHVNYTNNIDIPFMNVIVSIPVLSGKNYFMHIVRIVKLVMIAIHD